MNKINLSQSYERQIELAGIDGLGKLLEEVELDKKLNYPERLQYIRDIHDRMRDLKYLQ